MEKEKFKYPNRKFYKILLHAKCPQCGEGNMFKDSNPYHLYNYDKMNKYCSYCKLDFENETGFYFGAMYVSYGLGVALSGINFLVYLILFGFDPIIPYLIANSIILIGIWPIIFRISRVLYLWMMELLFPESSSTPDSQ
ncbi:MAG: DUF983 domain-containing protein [Chitinophagales bacterium]|nr:DUF983 domain-containing protein [Chitinophagales bacterium]MCZ2392745.1 DUF983 domain-containing protein [Chitinophagales bacterium]